MALALVSSHKDARDEVIRSLLLSAPRGRRLDLAVGTLLYRVQRTFFQVVDGQTWNIIPVWFFVDPVQDRRVWYYLVQARAWTPETHPKERRPGPVPAYTSNPAALAELRTWLTDRGMKYTLSHGEHLQVTITGKDRKTVCEASSRHPEREADAQICYLFARAAVSLCAPDLIPLLDSDELPDEQRPRSFLDWPHLQPAQELVFVPVYLPVTSFERRCQYQEYDLDQDGWRFCQQKWREEDGGGVEPEQCSCCGGYFCAEHFSPRTIWLDTASHPFREQRNVCQMCALLPEEDRLRLTETRLVLNMR